MKIDKSKIDVAAVFLIFMAVCGDVQKTAAALDLDPKIVEALAEQEGWNEKIRRISLLSKSEKPGDWERAQNRALAFCQAHRIRRLIDRLILKFEGMSNNQLEDALCTKSPNGLRGNLSARFFSDLASAAEKAHHLAYTALGDTVQERQASEDGDSGSAAKLHAALISALNNPAMAGKESELLVKEASDVIVESKKLLSEQSG